MFGQREPINTDATAPIAPLLPVDPISQLPTEAPVIGAPVLPTTSTNTVASFSSATLDTPTSAPTTSPVMAPLLSTDELVSMKQEALKHLQPLVDTLQQTPEEEFRTIMMMIQATDDRSMLKKALDSAKKISDDKVRAQAMLDVINEINYFTQTAQE